jgi:hypothetical protein
MAVMLAVPTDTAVTTPSAETVAMAVLPEVHVTARPVSVAPFASRVVAVACAVPTAVMEFGVRVTLTVATGTAVTLIDAVPVCPSLVAVMVAAPTDTAVTRPLVLTVATPRLLELHATGRPLRTSPLAARITAVACVVAPAMSEDAASVTLTVATGTGFTVIEDVPVFVSLVAVIVTGPPAATAVTRPFPSTVAAAVLLDVHVTTRPVSTRPFASLVTAVNCCVGVTPTTNVADVGLTVTIATGTGLTVIAGVVALGADSLVAVIVAVPTVTAVTVVVPLVELAGLSESTAVLLETQPTVRPESMAPFTSLVTAVSTCVPPTTIGVVGVESVTVATGAGLTVITAVVALGAVSLVAVIVAVPVATAVTVVVPLVELAGFNVSTAVLLETQLTVRPVSTAPFTSFVTAVSTCVPPTTIGVVGLESVTLLTGASVTVIEDVPVFVSLVAVIVVPPAATAVTRPFPSTVAAAGLLEAHVTTRAVSTLLAASCSVAVNCCVGVTPRTKLAVAGFTVTVATGSGAGLTAIAGVVALGAVSLVAVIVAAPGPAAVTVTAYPLGLTVSTAVLLETHLTTRPVSAVPVPSLVTAVKTCVPPTTIGVVRAESVTVATGTGFTVTTGVVAFGAVSLVAVIVAVPGPVAVTVTVAPLDVLTELAALTVSTAVLLETQFTVRPARMLLLPSFGVAVNTCVPPATIGVVGAESITVATGNGFTVIEDVPVFVSLVAVIVTGPPAATAVTRPFASTVAATVLLELHVTVRLVSTLLLASLSKAVSCCVPPTVILAVGGVNVTVATASGRRIA